MTWGGETSSRAPGLPKPGQGFKLCDAIKDGLRARARAASGVSSRIRLTTRWGRDVVMRDGGGLWLVNNRREQI